MAEQIIYHAVCPRTGQHFLIDARDYNGNRLASNFVDVPEAQAAKRGISGGWNALYAGADLRACRWCGSRKVGGCSCQRSRGKCPEPGGYSYQCLFCSNLEPASQRATDVRTLRLSVTAPKFDDIGPLLVGMGLNIQPFSRTGFDCDILFINCGTGDVIDPVRLHDFVWAGGCVYVSDLAVSHLMAAFPGVIRVDTSGRIGTYSARIVDPELKSIIGDSVRVCYDLSNWAVIRYHQGDSLIRGGSANATMPMMVTLKQGRGQIFYTSFHNHKQALDRELAVLKLMLLRQIGSVVHQSIEEVGETLGLNISKLGSEGRR